jgi:hypothetical protein
MINDHVKNLLTVAASCGRQFATVFSETNSFGAGARYAPQSVWPRLSGAKIHVGDFQNVGRDSSSGVVMAIEHILRKMLDRCSRAGHANAHSGE